MEEFDAYERLLRELVSPERPFLSEDPKWVEASKCHDWRNHINDAVKAVWDDLPVMARLVAYIHACEQARNEKWD